MISSKEAFAFGTNLKLRWGGPMIENDRSAGRTIDRASGVFLELVSVHAPTSIFVFQISDRDAVIKIGAERDDEMRPDGTYFIEYKISSLSVSGPAHRENYVDLIKGMIATFGDNFGYRGDLIAKLVVKVEFSDGVTKAMESWERD